VNGEMVHQGDPSERTFVMPTPGAHTILCMDDEGLSSQVQIVVR